eukprot:TRINITY_DN36535_c0_g1_i1.p1 TRINITY_DN36535_c0_g1~~TRINITY_DN36535_c0_g1_i1.p1  ORF type:complete len:517 (+),score=64.66 TRINITY_DN36535_c0_g1_i1:202-1752(+)
MLPPSAASLSPTTAWSASQQGQTDRRQSSQFPRQPRFLKAKSVSDRLQLTSLSAQQHGERQEKDLRVSFRGSSAACSTGPPSHSASYADGTTPGGSWTAWAEEEQQPLWRVDSRPLRGWTSSRSMQSRNASGMMMTESSRGLLGTFDAPHAPPFTEFAGGSRFASTPSGSCPAFQSTSYPTGLSSSGASTSVLVDGDSFWKETHQASWRTSSSIMERMFPEMVDSIEEDWQRMTLYGNSAGLAESGSCRRRMVSDAWGAHSHSQPTSYTAGPSPSEEWVEEPEEHWDAERRALMETPCTWKTSQGWSPQGRSPQHGPASGQHGMPEHGAALKDGLQLTPSPAALHDPDDLPDYDWLLSSMNMELPSKPSTPPRELQDAMHSLLLEQCEEDFLHERCASHLERYAKQRELEDDAAAERGWLWPPTREDLASYMEEGAEPERHSSERLPSLGSVGHASGECRPCAHIWRPQGCNRGEFCKRCHLCDEAAFRSYRHIIKEGKQHARRGRRGGCSTRREG